MTIAPGQTWFISDTHFGHKNILKFDPAQAKRWRSVEARDIAMVRMWNETVKPEDEVFHLGDVALGRGKGWLGPLLKRLNGKKFLLLGNHDKFPASWYMEHFTILRQPFPWRDHFVLTHAPIHPMCLSGRFKWNIHGHIHLSKVPHSGVQGRWSQPDKRYVNVCVEHTGFKPLNSSKIIDGLWWGGVEK